MLGLPEWRLPHVQGWQLPVLKRDKGTRMVAGFKRDKVRAS